MANGTISNININSEVYEVVDKKSRTDITSLNNRIYAKYKKLDSKVLEGGYFYIAETANTTDNKVEITDIKLDAVNPVCSIMTKYPVKVSNDTLKIVKAQYIDYLVTESGWYEYEFIYMPLASSISGMSDMIKMEAIVYENS